MHFSTATAYFIAAFSLAQLSAAHPAKASAVQPPATTITGNPWIEMHHDRDEHGKRIKTSSLITVYTNVTVYAKYALIRKSLDECEKTCDWEHLKEPPWLALNDCMGGTFNKRTKVCRLIRNKKEIVGAPKKNSCPLGILKGNAFKSNQTVDELEKKEIDALWNKDQHMYADEDEEEEYCKHHDCDEYIISAGCHVPSFEF